VVPPVPIPNTEVKRCSPNGSASLGCARVGRRQNYEPRPVKAGRGSLVFGSLFNLPRARARARPRFPYDQQTEDEDDDDHDDDQETPRLQSSSSFVLDFFTTSRPVDQLIEDERRSRSRSGIPRLHHPRPPGRKNRPSR
jgi:hypothetical protein